LSEIFSVNNGLKEGKALPPLFSNLPIYCPIREIQVNQDNLKLNGAYQFLGYINDVTVF